MKATIHNRARRYVAGAMACTATIGLLAQAAPVQRPPSGPTTTDRHVVIGCVARQAQPATAASRGSAAAPRFTITDTRGERPTYRLQGDAKEFDLHVGHTVELAGTLSPEPSAGRGTNANAFALTVASLTYISPTCAK